MTATLREARIPQWREILFGEWSLSPSVWIIQSVLGVGILSVRLRELGLVSHGYGTTLLLGPAGSALVLWIASRTVLRDRSVGPAMPGLVVAVWLVADVSRGLAAAGLGVVPLSPVTVVANIVVSVLWTGIFTYLLASSQFFPARSREMDAAIDATARYDDQKASLLQVERGRLLMMVQDELLPSLIALRADVTGLAGRADRRAWLSLADRVGGLIIERVRSVSRPTGLALDPSDLRDDDARLTRTRWRHVIDDARTAEVSVTLSLVLFLAGALLVLIPRVGLIGYAFLACIAACAVPLLLIGRWVVSRTGGGWRHAIALPVTFLVIGLVVGRLSVWFPGGREVHSTIALEAVIAVFGTLTGVGASLVRQHQRRWEAMFAAQVIALERYEEVRTDLDREHLQIQRQMSNLLHGPVQGNLAALTLALRMHAATPEEEGFEAGQAVVLARGVRLIDEAIDTLREILEEPRPVATILADDLAGLTRAWRGLLDIDVSVSAQASDMTTRDGALARTALGIVEEGIINASRHGDARHVSVRLGIHGGGDLEVQLDNDGTPLSPSFHAGFGLKSIEAAGGRWSLVQVAPGRTRLTAWVPVAG